MYLLSIMANITLKVTGSYCENIGPGPLGPWIMDTIYVICVFGSMLTPFLWETQFFKKSQIEALLSQKTVQINTSCDLVLIFGIACDINAIEWVVRNLYVGVLGTTNRWDMTLDRRYLPFSVAASLISPWLLSWPPAESHYNIYDRSVVGYGSHVHCVGNKNITTTSEMSVLHGSHAFTCV